MGAGRVWMDGGDGVTETVIVSQNDLRKSVYDGVITEEEYNLIVEG